jgi:hypothetical protein
MFIGHYALGFAAKKWAPKAPLEVLFMAALWLDLLWPVFVLLGMEHFTINKIPAMQSQLMAISFNDWPLSHSLVMAVAWGLGFALVYFLLSKDSRGSLTVGGLVLSNWILDFITHHKDLPILPAQDPNAFVTKYGLGLWNSFWGTVALETILLIAGLVLYLKATKAVHWTGHFLLWSLVVFLVLSYSWELLFPPFDDVNLEASLALLQWVAIVWAFWVDLQRKTAKARR